MVAKCFQRVKPDEVEDAFWHLYANNHLPSGVEKVEDLRISGFANKSCAELFTEDKVSRAAMAIKMARLMTTIDQC